jgi:putative transposase
VKLTAQVKLITTPEQSESLAKTVRAANAACDVISEWAWENQTFGQYHIHRSMYARVRAESGLTAQVVVRCISKVADAYKLDKSTKRFFQPSGAIAYDSRILRWQLGQSQVSIWTVDGRMTIPFVCGDGQKRLLETQQGETDLCSRGGVYYLNATCNVEELPPSDTSGGVLGVDFGIVNIAVDSIGNRYGGSELRAYRRRAQRLRSGLQSCGTKSAKRHLKRAGQRVSRYQRWVNHNISKQIVQTAIKSRKAIAIEDLKGIRQRASAFGRDMRRELGNWAFAQLGGFTIYKATRAGVPSLQIEARGTSRTCRMCGCCDKANRKSQAIFHCIKCGHHENADDNASCHIELRDGDKLH